jgi:hypothetical protein
VEYGLDMDGWISVSLKRDEERSVEKGVFSSKREGGSK